MHGTEGISANQVPRLSPRARAGDFVIVESGPEHLVLRGHVGIGILKIIVGLLLAFWGVFPWMALVSGHDQSILIVAFLLTPAGLFLMFNGIGHATLRYTFDGARQSLVLSRRFRKPEVRSRGAFTHVAINILPTTSEQGETVQLHLMQLGADPGSADRKIVIGARRSKRKDAVNLVLTAVAIARLLNHSIEVRGDCKQGNPPLLQALDIARAVVKAPTLDDSPS